MYFEEVKCNLIIKFNIFKEFKNIFAAVTTRKTQTYSVSDEKKHWVLYQEKLFDSIGVPLSNISYLKQTHSNVVKLVKKSGFRGCGDGMFTFEKGNFLVITVADCVPVYFYIPEIELIGLVHCGWKGLKKGIIEKSLNILEKEIESFNVNNLYCVIGPHIKQCCYEFDEEDALSFGSKYIKKEKKNKVRLDLTGIVTDQLISEGVKLNNIEISPFCTSCNAELFYSYRRDKSLKGRMIGIIGLYY